jgi:hypothetical protein
MSNQPFDPAVNPISQVTGWRQQVRDAQRITALENHASVLGSALSGDMKLQISPATAAGAAADTATITVTGGTILGHSVSNVTSVDTLLS